MILHEFADSGNCYKVRLVCAMLGLPLKRREVNILEGESHTPEFRRLNANAKVPVLELADGRTLAESNAIMEFIAHDTELVPDDPFRRAQMHQWMYFEQYQVEPTIAVVRFWLKHVSRVQQHGERIAELRLKAGHALSVMDQHLEQHRWFVGEHITLADIALYGYTHVADEGEFDLSAYTNVQRWLEDVASRPGHVRITA